jgi:hypothetical protein
MRCADRGSRAPGAASRRSQPNRSSPKTMCDSTCVRVDSSGSANAKARRCRRA